MIDKSEMVEMFRGINPRYDAVIDGFLDDWLDDPETAAEGLPDYLLLNEIAYEIATDIRKGDTAHLEPIFDLIERLHLEGTDYVKEAATIGLLEDLQNLMLADNTGLHLAHPYLGKESKLWWDKLILFWNGDANALQYD